MRDAWVKIILMPKKLRSDEGQLCFILSSLKNMPIPYRRGRDAHAPLQTAGAYETLFLPFGTFAPKLILRVTGGTSQKPLQTRTGLMTHEIVRKGFL